MVMLLAASVSIFMVVVIILTACNISIKPSSHSILIETGTTLFLKPTAAILHHNALSS